MTSVLLQNPSFFHVFFWVCYDGGKADDQGRIDLMETAVLEFLMFAVS